MPGIEPRTPHLCSQCSATELYDNRTTMTSPHNSHNYVHEARVLSMYPDLQYEGLGTSANFTVSCSDCMHVPSTEKCSLTYQVHLIFKDQRNCDIIFTIKMLHLNFGNVTFFYCVCHKIILMLPAGLLTSPQPH